MISVKLNSRFLFFPASDTSTLCFWILRVAFLRYQRREMFVTKNIYKKQKQKQNWMQGWQYVKELIYLRTIFQLTKLAFLRARERERKKHFKHIFLSLGPTPHYPGSATVRLYFLKAHWYPCFITAAFENLYVVANEMLNWADILSSLF